MQGSSMRYPWLPRDLRYEVVRLWLRGVAAKTTASIINKELERRSIDDGRLDKGKVRAVLADAWEEKHFLLKPPAHTRLAGSIAAYCQVHDEQVQVVRSPLGDEQETLDAAAQRAARLTRTLIERLSSQNDEVHVGIGAGQTSYLACVWLAHELAGSAKLLRSQTRLVFHAISPGCDAERPLDDPSAKFALLDRIGLPTGFVGLFAEAVVPSERINEVRRLPGAKAAFDRKNEIDIVLTSLASRHSAHGLWNRYAKCYPAAIEKLEGLGWIGDLHFRPYSQDGPIRENVGIEAVTLFSLDELRTLAEHPDRHVVLVSGPGKSDALIPVVCCPELRCWDHLVTDVASALKIESLRKGSASAPDATNAAKSSGIHP